MVLGTPRALLGGMKIHAPLLLHLFVTLASSGCKSKHETNAESFPPPANSAVALPAPAPVGPVVSCFNLPPKERVRMHVSDDRKTIYYFEVTREFNAAAGRKDRYALVAMDVATRTAKIIDDNVGRWAVVTKKGQVVFTRSETGSTEYGTNRRLYLREPNQAEPIMLSPKKGKDISDILVDEKSASVYYEEDFKIYRVPLAGGTPKKVADGWSIDAVLEDGLLVRELFDRRKLVRFDGKKGKEYKIKDEMNFAGMSNGFMMVVAEEQNRLVLQAKPLEGNDPNAKNEVPIERGAKSLYWGEFGQEGQVLARYAKDNRVYRVQGTEAKNVFTSTGANLGGYVEIEDGTKVVLACHDTHDNDSCGDFDESDICFVERASANDVVEIPTRKEPTALKETAEKLSVLTKDEDLIDAKMKFLIRDDGGYRVQFTTPHDGPANVDELRARARALQTRVTEVSGMPTLSVSIHFANGYTSSTLWHDGTKRFYSKGGLGLSELADVKEYPLEIDTTIVTSWDNATCRGKLKNISDQPMENITVECTPVDSSGPRKASGRGKLSPTKLPPGVEGQFVTANFEYYDYRSSGVHVSVKQGDQEILPFNRYMAKKGRERWDEASAVYIASGLVYLVRLTEKDVDTVLVLAGPVFQKSEKGEQEKACAKAIDEMVKLRLVTKVAAKKAVLKIRDPLTNEVQWEYKDGQLSKLVD